MIFQIFTFGLKYKPTRKLLLKSKKCRFARALVPMIKEWYEKDYIMQCAKVNLIGYKSLNNFNHVTIHTPFTKALIVTDKTLVSLEVVAPVIKQLKKLGKAYVIFDGVEPNPSTMVTEAIVDSYRVNRADALITVGGGSAHDAAKAANLLLCNKKPIRKLQGINVTKNGIRIPLICINTTAGTGSEVTNVAVITDEVSRFKMTLVDKHCQPRVSVNDSELMMGLPANTTAWCGLDALVHAIEAYLSINTNSFVKTYARQAMDIISQYLLTAYSTPKNIVAREKMAFAEFMAGIAFNSASLGFVHSMAHAISAVFNTPHGLAVAVMLPYVLDYELRNKKIAYLLGEISDHMNFDNLDVNWFNKAQTCVKKIMEFTKQLGIPHCLNDIQKDISMKQLKLLTTKAMKDFCGISNPIQLSAKEVQHIYANAVIGKFDNLDN